MPRAFIGYGSNLGRRRASIERALLLVHALPATAVLEQSGYFATDPWAMPAGTPPFLNGCAMIETQLSPRALLEHLHRIERLLGRSVHRGSHGEYLSRTIDLDILLYEGAVQDGPPALPHPELAARRFVLAPLCEIAPGTVHPVLGKTIRQLLDECPDRGRVWVVG